MSEGRPDPDALLLQVQADEARERRGKLKLFFGFAPGVGKTYAMLEAAHRARGAAVDVVIGVVETHGRSETSRLIDGLEQLPRRAVEYRGTSLQELDVAAVLARRPQLVLVDELAHSNAPGSRHSKRWQDVFELLDAGIDVWTTVNVQHVASLNDVVFELTRVQVREVVPDHVIDRAADIELIDVSPEVLLGRLRDGKVYRGEIAARDLGWSWHRHAARDARVLCAPRGERRRGGRGGRRRRRAIAARAARAADRHRKSDGARARALAARRRVEPRCDSRAHRGAAQLTAHQRLARSAHAPGCDRRGRLDLGVDARDAEP